MSLHMDSKYSCTIRVVFVMLEESKVISSLREFRTSRTALTGGAELLSPLLHPSAW